MTEPTAAVPAASVPAAPAVPRRTALHGRHVALGAKLADFGGWEMPIEYPAASGGGVLREHQAVRERVGLFDVSHLGKVAVRGRSADGATAAAFVDSCLSNALTRIGPGQAQYTLCCDDVSGGVVDDLIVYLRAEDDLLLVPNAANSGEVARRLAAAAPDGVTVEDRHEELGVLAVQGPAADDVLTALGLPVKQPYMGFTTASWQGEPLTVCRTGYTGERGYELLPSSAGAPALWDALLAAVLDLGGLPCGLGARDTLRTEMGYALHGHELSLDVTPVQARVGWAVGWRKPAFWGREVLLAERERGATRTAWGLLALERGVPRADCVVLADDGREVGVTTSGTFSPTLKQGIALALLSTGSAAATGVAEGDEVFVDVRGRSVRCRVVKPPFVPSHTA